MRLELNSLSAISATFREINKPAQAAFIFALFLTALGILELVFPFRPRWNDWFITKTLRSSLGPKGPALLPLTTAVFLYFYAIGSLFGSTNRGKQRRRLRKQRK